MGGKCSLINLDLQLQRRLTEDDSPHWLLTPFYYLSITCCTLPDKRCLSHGMCLYYVMMTLHFLNEVAKDSEST